MCDFLEVAWRAEEEVDFVEWLDTHFELASESSGVASKWETRAFQRAMCYSMADLDIPVFIELKPAQVGATKRLVGYYGYTIRERQRNVGIWQPTRPDIEDFVDVQITPMLRDVDRVREAMLDGVDPEQLSKFNSKQKKIYRWATGYHRSARSARGFRGITLDDAILDDFDGMEARLTENGKSVGSPRSRAWLRTRTSTARKLFLVSTPTEYGKSNIWDAAHNADALFRRYFPCLNCGFYQLMNFSGTADADDGLTWQSAGTAEKCAKTACFICSNCKHEHNYGSMRDMDLGGEWRSDDLIQLDSDGSFHLKAKTKTGYRKRCIDALDKPQQIAYHYNALVSYEESWQSTVEFYLKAMEFFDRTKDDSELATFNNEYLAKVHRREGTESISPNDLVGRLITYRADVPAEVQFITAGIDVGKTYFQYEIIGWGHLRRSWSITCGTIPCRTADPDDPGWDVLAKFLDRRYNGELGRQMIVSCAFIDSRYNPDQVKAFCAQNPYQRVAAQGQPNPKAPMLNISPRPTSQDGCYIGKIGTTRGTQRVYQMLEEQDPEASGYCSFPRTSDYYAIDEETGELTSNFFDELTAEILEVQPDNEIKCVNRRPNHYHDCRRMGTAAMEALIKFGYQLVNEDDWLAQGAGEVDENDPYQAGYQVGGGVGV